MNADDHEAVFRRWVGEHMGLMFKVVRGCSATPEDHEDLLQDILLQLWLSIPSFRGEAKETTWIYRVAFNTALAWQRGEKRRRVGHESFLQLDTSPRIQASRDQEIPKNELIEQVYAAVRQLPKVDASLALMHLDGLSYREMGEVLGISETNVGVRLTRIRRHLADQLKGVVHEL